MGTDRTIGHAGISRCRLYRYFLVRRFHEDVPFSKCLTIVMLNPSTADATNDDATIRRCMGFAKTWGYPGIRVINLYALRATNPKDLWTANDPVGPMNSTEIGIIAGEVDHMLVAWGNHAKPEQVRWFLEIIDGHFIRLECLGMNKSGAPKHPLYVPSNASRIPWVRPL